MSVNGLADALTELLDNEAFAGQVEADASAALAGYDLTDQERAMLVDDAATLNSETSGFSFQGLKSGGEVRLQMAQLGPRSGALLAGAVSRTVDACGEHGCCSWETALK